VLGGPACDADRHEAEEISPSWSFADSQTTNDADPSTVERYQAEVAPAARRTRHLRGSCAYNDPHQKPAHCRPNCRPTTRTVTDISDPGHAPDATLARIQDGKPANDAPEWACSPRRKGRGAPRTRAAVPRSRGRTVRLGADQCGPAIDGGAQRPPNTGSVRVLAGPTMPKSRRLKAQVRPPARGGHCDLGDRDGLSVV
jgi:hypothetical protein